MALDQEPVADAAAAPVVAAPSAPAPSEDAHIPPNPHRLRRFARAGLLGGLFALALIISWQLQGNTQSDEDTGAASALPPKAPLKKIDSEGNAVENLARGDEALESHLYAAALSYYEQLLGDDAGAAAIVEYRFGLCHEALGKTDRAIAAYRKAISHSTSPALTLASELAMARCLLTHHEPAQARRILYPWLFDESRLQDVPKAFVVDARYLVALAWARQVLTPPSERLVDDNAISFTAVPLEIPFYLDVVGLGAKPKQAAADKKPTPLAVRPRTDKQPALIASIDDRDDTAWQLLGRVATQAGLRLDGSAGAKQALEERSLRLCLRNWPAADLLEGIADFFDLTVWVDGAVVHIQTRQEADAQRLAGAERALTGRLLREALGADPSHAWAPAVSLELGNMAAAQEQTAEAVKRYTAIVRTPQASPYLGPAYYNLAKLQQGKVNVAHARQAFFRVVDQCAGHELAARAQWRIGQLYLEEEDTGPAIVQLRRAQAVTPGSPYQPLITLTLAAAYLGQDRPEETCLLLAGRRLQLQKEPYKTSAAFLDAFAQFRLAKATNTGRREASELLSTLWRDQQSDLLGIFGQYLKAQAFRDIGFWDQAEKLLRGSIKETRGPMSAALEYLLAQTLQQQNHGEEAGRVFDKLAKAPSAYRARARLQLAQIDLRAKKYQECARKCQELWAEQSLPDGAALLQTWGAALEGAGDFTKAAQCFAGKAPQ